MTDQEHLATHGRTIYPRGADPGRWAFVDRRERRPFAERAADVLEAAAPPEGRARHLVERFPPLTGHQGVEFYGGAGREELLGLLYLTVIADSPGLMPEPTRLARVAELGEETALDLELAGLDREARLRLDAPPLELWDRLGVRVAAAWERGDDVASRLFPAHRSLWMPRAREDGEPYITEPPFAGVRQILDALLMVADDGHAPGTRMRMLSGPGAGRTATVVHALWGPSGSPVAYRLRDDVTGAEHGAATGDLLVLMGQECLGR